VFSDAEFAEKSARARKLLPRARKAVKTKIGVSENLKPMLERLFSINQSLIPDDSFNDYVALVDMFGAAERVLNLDDISDVTRKTQDILNAIQSEALIAAGLKHVFDNYQNKVIKSNGEIDYSATLNDMVDKRHITSDVKELMMKYKNLIFPPEPKTQAEIDAENVEKEQRRQSLIPVAAGMRINPYQLAMRNERDDAKRFAELASDQEILKRLSLNELENLIKVIDNINNGFFPAYAYTMLTRMESIKNAYTL
jgi:hypothetical protein